MNVIIKETEHDFDTALAWELIAQILKKPDSVIGLSTGNTTANMFNLVSEIYERYPFDTSKITIFNVDELSNIERENFHACYTRVWSPLGKHIGIRPEQFIMPRSLGVDYDEEAQKWLAEINARGQVDLQILGLGWNGHVGINQPGTPFDQSAHNAPLDERLDERLTKQTGRKLGGMTLGIADIMRSKRVLMVAKGKEKAGIVHRTVKGRVSADIPASVFQLHPDFDILLDREAAAELL